jgi:hypothetical protein
MSCVKGELQLYPLLYSYIAKLGLLTPRKKKTKYNVEYFKLGMVSGDPGSPVSIVFGYGLDDRAIDIRSPAEAKGFVL